MNAGRLILFVAIAAVVALLRIDAEAAPPSNTLIVPGESIGTLSLGMSKDAVLAALGHPDRVDAISSLPKHVRPLGVSMFAEQYHYAKYGVDVFIEALASSVAAITTYNPAVKTASGLRVGSSRASVHKVFGTPQHEDLLDKEIYLGGYIKSKVAGAFVDSWPSKGIAFIYWCSESVDCDNQLLHRAPLGPDLTVGSIEVYRP